MCQQHQLLRAPHAQLYMMPLHLVQRHHRVQSNCLADVKMLLTAPRFRFGRSNQNRNLIKWTHSHVFVGKCFDSIIDLLHFHRWFERICKQLSVEIHLYRIYGLNLVFLWPFWCFVFRFCFGKFVFLEFTFVDWFELWQTWMVYGCVYDQSVRISFSIRFFSVVKLNFVDLIDEELLWCDQMVYSSELNGPKCVEHNFTGALMIAQNELCYSSQAQQQFNIQP